MDGTVRTGSVNLGRGSGRNREVLVVNAGSSSLKLTVLGESDRPIAAQALDHWDGEDVAPIAAIVDEVGASELSAVGHRVVHGGVELQRPVVVDDDVVKQIEALTPLAPLHQGRALAGLAAAQAAVPAEIPHVACFDTAFHATLPAFASTYALPTAWRSRWGLRRFGFHGLSHAYAVAQAAELVQRTGDPKLRVVSCHLGAGASLCAAKGGRSVDTTMGFTPLEGLVMATRAGSVDPGLVLWLMTEAGLSAAEVTAGLERRSGLQGLAGTPDMAEVVEGMTAGDPDDQLAFDVYIRALAQAVAAMVVSLGGLDVLVFTGGVGEHAPAVRAAAAERLAHLGIAVDPDRNTADCAYDRTISPTGAAVRALVVEAREDLTIASEVRSVL
jgi:acetate kinase